MTALFIQKVGIYGPRLIHDIGFGMLDCAAAYGSIGHESNGFLAYHEGGQAPSRGGVSWCQWTDARRRLFEAWCHQHGLALTSDAAGYGFLVHELTGSEAGAISAMRRHADLHGKVVAFTDEFERPRVKAIASREKWARLALSVLQPGHHEIVTPPPVRKVARKPVADRHRVGKHHHG
ncbi:phage tail tip lysozyme [Methylobacterium sp. E-005]|uniref:phage tail tip lysozyme n=1 Tax=Methylobacterium sp. E-005 TaxID=2836549 RepID=UPI001FB941E2|nr:phage tail tip lysozyme [Methylobacterium sp. E-005]MCJ2085491.1 phage tail tip lysozyme [Methylobacterium sp. E-005]